MCLPHSMILSVDCINISYQTPSYFWTVSRLQGFVAVSEGSLSWPLTVFSSLPRHTPAGTL